MTPAVGSSIGKVPPSFDSLSRIPTTSLEEIPRFEGLGIYALYYSGSFPAYEPLAHANRQCPGSWPIYIGKAEASARKGEDLKAPDDYSGKAL